MSRDSYVKKCVCENPKNWGYKDEVYFDCPHLFLSFFPWSHLTDRTYIALDSLRNHRNAAATKLPLLQ